MQLSELNEAPWSEDEMSLNKNSKSPVVHKDLTIDNYDLDDWEPTQYNQ